MVAKLEIEEACPSFCSSDTLLVKNAVEGVLQVRLQLICSIVFFRPDLNTAPLNKFHCNAGPKV